MVLAIGEKMSLDMASWPYHRLQLGLNLQNYIKNCLIVTKMSDMKSFFSYNQRTLHAQLISGVVLCVCGRLCPKIDFLHYILSKCLFPPIIYSNGTLLGNVKL